MLFFYFIFFSSALMASCQDDGLKTFSVECMNDFWLEEVSFFKHRIPSECVSSCNGSIFGLSLRSISLPCPFP